MLFVTNEHDQVAYLFAVKCGDIEMIEYTSNGGELSQHRDIFGRNAVFFSVFSLSSVMKFFQGENSIDSIPLNG